MIAGHTAPTNDRHDKKRLSELGVRAKILNAQRENRREHNRVKEAKQNNGRQWACLTQRDDPARQSNDSCRC